MAQLQAFGITRAAGNRTQAVAVDLYRNAVGCIRQQQNPRGVGHQLNHLPHQTASIEYWLTQHDTVPLTFVDDDAMGKGVRVHTDQLGDFNLFVDQRRRVEQLAQTNVLLSQGSQFLHAALQQNVFGFEFLVFSHQLSTAAKLTGNALKQALRQVSDPVGLHQHQRYLAAHGL